MLTSKDGSQRYWQIRMEVRDARKWMENLPDCQPNLTQDKGLRRCLDHCSQL